MSATDFDHVDDVPRSVRLRAHEAVSAVVSDDHNYERGVDAARAVAHGVHAEYGAEGLTEMAVALSLKLAEAIERIAADQGLTATDLTDVWFAA